MSAVNMGVPTIFSKMEIMNILKKEKIWVTEDHCLLYEMIKPMDLDIEEAP
tara:strand:- start:550 stop:702 length:153 start_codon:yes stop_codon:yes gene_type:complete